MISSGEKPLAELIRQLVREELKRTEVTGRGGNTLITSNKDIHIVTTGDHKAFYNGVEIGSGGGAVTSVFGRTGAVVAVATDYSMYVRKDAGAGDQTQNNLQIHKTNIQMDDFYAVKLYGDSTYLGYISGAASDMTEGHWHYGVKMMSQLGPTTSSFYIGEDPLTVPNGVAILTSGIYLSSSGGVTVHDYLTLDPTAGDPTGANGRLAYNSTSGKFRAYQAGAWVDAVGGVTAHSALTQLDYASAGHTGFFPISAGLGVPMTGALYVETANPLLQLVGSTYSLIRMGALDSTNESFIDSQKGDLIISALTSGKVIKLNTLTSTRLTIADTAITAAVDVVLGTNKLRGTAGGGSDVILGDDISMLKAAATYGDIKNVGVFSFGANANTKIDNNAGSLRFTVAAGEVFEFIVSA